MISEIKDLQDEVREGYMPEKKPAPDAQQQPAQSNSLEKDHIAMNAEQQAQQLRLAADIIETGHPWEYRTRKDANWNTSSAISPTYVFTYQHGEIRIVFATPPDGRHLHNPDNLDAEQVGVGWRLTLAGERHHDQAQLWNYADKLWVEKPHFADGAFYTSVHTYRVPLSVPWPEVEKPEPAFQLPSPPPGMRWHRQNGWKEGDLPQGWRPLVVGEKEHDEDEFCSKLDNSWIPTPHGGRVVRTSYKVRTRHPLTFNHAGRQWTWHRPGDPRPCDGESMVHIITRDKDFSEEPSKSKDYEWGQIEGSWRFAEIIGWRYVDEKKVVPLDKDDILPCSVITGKDGGWVMVTGVGDDGVTVDARNEPVSFEELAEHARINRSIPLTGKWDPDAWEVCNKEVAV